MELDYTKLYKGLGIDSAGPKTHQEQGAAFFTAGHMGDQINDRLDGYAARAKMTRRDMIKTSFGFAGILYAVNEITGMRFFDVDEVEAREPEAAIERAAMHGGQLVVDQHTHICWRKDGYVLGKNTTEKGMWFVNLLDGLGKAMGFENGIRDMNVDNFGKVILDESDTDIAIFNPFGFRESYGGFDMVPIEEQAEVKERWPDRTIMLGGGLTPNQGMTETLERLEMFVEDFHISGLKLYTFDATPQRGWWMDDEKRAYKIWEKCRDLGIKNIGCHKGIPFGQFAAKYAHPEDFDAVCDVFLDMNFIAFHSAWPYHAELAGIGKGFKPQRTNMYCELGSTFAATITNRPLECAHILGMLLRDIGDDYVMWGSDSTLWANPQWQIEAFRKFRIPDQLVEGHGYPQLTDEVKAKILGLNAARIWGIDVNTKKIMA